MAAGGVGWLARNVQVRRGAGWLARNEPARDGKIVVVARREGALVVAELSDNGPRIRAEVIHRVFEPFFTTKPVGEGTGLGLFLSRDIVRRHGGGLRVRSSAQHGTTFVVDLPADPAQAAHSDAEQPEQAAPTAGNGRYDLH